MLCRRRPKRLASRDAARSSTARGTSRARRTSSSSSTTRCAGISWAYTGAPPRRRSLIDSRASIYHAVTPERMTIKYFRQRAYNQGISDSYSALRLSPEAAISISGSSFNVRKSLRRFIGHFMPPYDAELRNLNLAIKEGYQEGYGYHQRLYAEDPKVKAWVHQPNYL